MAENEIILPVEPPSSSVGLGAGAAFWRLIIVTVKGREKVVIVGRKAIRRVAIVVEYTQPEIIIFVPDAAIKRGSEWCAIRKTERKMRQLIANFMSWH